MKLIKRYIFTLNKTKGKQGEKNEEGLGYTLRMRHLIHLGTE